MLLALAMISPATAQDNYPSRPVTVLVGFAAGGFADSLARMVAPKLGEKFGQNIIVENRGGAGGNIAAGIVAKAQPDGFTVLVTTTGVSFYEALAKNKTFTLADLKAVAIPAWAPETLSVAPNYPAKTLAELIAIGKTRSVSYGTPGAGTASHIAAAYFFKDLAKINVVHVPFAGGAPAVNAAMGGHVDAITGAVVGYAGQLQSGAIRGSLSRATSAIRSFRTFRPTRRAAFRSSRLAPGSVSLCLAGRVTRSSPSSTPP